MILSSLRYFLEDILGRPKKQKSSPTINTARAKSPAPNTFNTLKQHILNNVFHFIANHIPKYWVWHKTPSFQISKSHKNRKRTIKVFNGTF